MLVVPAWFCSPVTAMRYCQMATIAVTTPMLQPGRFERVALLDMRLEEPGVARRIDLEPRPARIAGAVERRAHRGAVVAVARLVDVRLAEHADKRAAAEERAEMALLVAECRDVDADLAGLLGQRPRGFERIDDAECAVEPAGMILGFEMRAGEHLAAGRARAAEHIADAVDRRLEAGLRHAFGQPLARHDVFGREGRTMDAGLVGAEGAQRVQIAEHAVRIDRRHGSSLWQNGAIKQILAGARTAESTWVIHRP